MDDYELDAFEEKFVNDGASYCPICNSAEIEYGVDEHEGDPPNFFMDVKCIDCGSEWEAIFTRHQDEWGDYAIMTDVNLENLRQQLPEKEMK